MQQLVREQLCNYSTFTGQITQSVKENMGEEFTVRCLKVMKNNSLELDSLVILKKGKNFAPNIYLLPYYEEYIQGAGITDITEKLCGIYNNYEIPAMNILFSYSYSDVKSFIIYRLVSYERNEKLLKSIPHVRYLDMAITYHCLVREDNDGIGTIRITNEHMLMWEASPEELYELAVDNTSKLFPHSIRSMDDVILGMLGEEGMLHGEEEQVQTLQRELGYPCNDTHNKMYILTNHKGINGATCLLYANILKEFSRQIKSDFFIIPSSIHEVILVPCDRTITKEILTEMVKDVNRTQVARDEILSDNVYYYSSKKDALSM
jgi:hypothetical protein